ncbi:MAG: peptidase E [Bacteroidetes bacterium MedPE-SWsnd-G2]|nr:MAG: peptidase E [Bacteroidetes bacterium MedPE-SWsnd-G2]
MTALKVFVLLLAMPFLTNDLAHEYYVSVTQVEYVKEEQTIQCISRLFIDDIEKALRERYDESIVLAGASEAEEIDLYVERYLRSKIELIVNDNTLPFKFVGRKYEDDIMLCFFEVENVQEISKFEIINRLFFDIYPQQQNIIKTKINDTSNSLILISENDKGLLKF